VLAAHIEGKVQTEPPAKEDAKGKKGPPEKPHESVINAVVVCDIDMLSQDFFRLREQATCPKWASTSISTTSLSC